MASPFKLGIHSTGIIALVAMMAITAAPWNMAAQTHVVSTAELRQQAVDAGRMRATNLQKVSEFLTSPGADKALRASNMDLNQVKATASTLSDGELAMLAARADKAKAEFAAGTLSDRDLLIIIVGIAALILIIVAVR